MPTFLIILFFLYIVLMAVCVYGLIRTKKVRDFRLSVNEECFQWCKRHLYELTVKTEESAYDWCYHKMPDYDQMMWSCKPLTKENWLTPEQIQKLKS